MVRATDTLERQIRLYVSESGALRQRQDQAACADVQDVVAFANFLYDRIKRIDEEWSAELTAGNQSPSEADATAMQALYATWCATAESDLRRAAELDAGGCRINGLDRFRHAYYEARSILSIPTDRVQTAERHARDGQTRPLGAIRDELRSKLNP